MPLYRVQLKQGSNTKVNHIEAKSVSSVIDFYSAVTTMKLTEVLKVEYQAPNNNIPIDDFNYIKMFKGMVKNDVGEDKISKQIIVHNIKKTVSEDELFNLIKLHLEISSKKITGIYSGLFKFD